MHSIIYYYDLLISFSNDVYYFLEIKLFFNLLYNSLLILFKSDLLKFPER